MTDIDQKLGALYRAARAQEAPTRADRAAVRRALASALIVGTGAASAHAAASGVAATQTVKALTLGKIAGWLFVGAALGGVTSSAAWVLTSPPEDSTSTPQLASAKASAARSTQRAPSLPMLAQTAERIAEPELEGAMPLPSAGSAASAAPATGRERAPNPETPTLAPPSLAAEGEGLLAIQRTLASGDGPRALKMLGEQDTLFHDGALSEERAAVRVLAWCAAGQPEQARAARDRFFATYPHSPHAKRVQNSCAK